MHNESVQEVVAPHIIQLSSIGSSDIGFITVAEENRSIPFDIKRVFWTYFTPKNIHRGFHAHRDAHQAIFATSGKIKFLTEDRKGNKMEFLLEEPNQCLYIPPLTWKEMIFSHDAVLMCLTSEYYSAEEYIRDYDEFKTLQWK